MCAFDQLPPTARRALADAAFDWAPQQQLSRHRRALKGYRTGQEIAAHVASIDRNAHEKDAKRGKQAPLPRKAALKLERRAMRLIP